MNLKPTLPLFLSLLTGCAGIYGESFDCPPGEGVACKSISEVNRMIDRGEIEQKKGEHSTSESVDRLSPDTQCFTASLAISFFLFRTCKPRYHSSS